MVCDGFADGCICKLLLHINLAVNYIAFFVRLRGFALQQNTLSHIVRPIVLRGKRTSACELIRKKTHYGITLFYVLGNERRQKHIVVASSIQL